MAPSPIIYYGERGLERDVLLSYMRLSGYSIESILPNGLSSLSIYNPTRSIAIVSLPPDEPVLALVQQIRQQSRDCVKIFIIGDCPDVPADLPNVELIPRPAHLSTLIRRIRAFNREEE